MAVDYAKGLSDYDNKGICGLPEIKDDDDLIQNNGIHFYYLLNLYLKIQIQSSSLPIG